MVELEFRFGSVRNRYFAIIRKIWGVWYSREHLEEPGVQGRIILRFIFEKWDGRVAGTGFIWPRSDSISPTSGTDSVFIARTFIFLTRTANIHFLFSAIPQHTCIIISLIRCVGYAALLNFSTAIFLLLSSKEICFQVNILKIYCFCCVQWLRIVQIKGLTRVSAFSPAKGNRAGFRKV